MKACSACTPTRRQDHAGYRHRSRRARPLAKPLLAAAVAAFTVAAPWAWAAPLMDQADATRLLEQATFGPTDALIAHVQAEGIQALAQ